MTEKNLQTLLDRMEISDTVIKYATGVDMRDWALYRSCFTEDLEYDFSSWQEEIKGKIKADEWVEMVRGTLEGFDATQHISSNHVITLRGDEATCISYMQAQHYLVNDRGENQLMLGGYYTNQLVRTEEGWKICNCKLTVIWTTGNFHVFQLSVDKAAGKV